MIEAYCGYPGSGKSFGLTNRAWKAMRSGKVVFSSYYIKGAYKLTFQDLIDYTFPKGSTVIIDESGRWFNARKWKDLPSEVFDLFTLHRHMELDLLIAVQNFNRIDVSLREVVELVWWASSVPLVPMIRYEGYYDVDKLGMKGEADLKSYIWKWSRSRKLYDTHAMSTAVNKDEIPRVSWDDQQQLQEGQLDLSKAKEIKDETDSEGEPIGDANEAVKPPISAYDDWNLS